MNKSYCLRGVRVQSVQGLGEEQDFWVKEGVWVDTPVADAPIVDATGGLVLPGLVALHVDFQEPAHDEVYTLADGFEALRRGGFSHALYESSANPIDDTYKLDAMRNTCQGRGAHLSFLGALSVGNKGGALAEMLELARAGVSGFGDGSQMPQSLRFLRRAFEYSAMTLQRLHFQPLEMSLAGKGCVHEGNSADTLGMRGIPYQAETIAVYQLIELAHWFHVPLHLKHISCAESLAQVRAARSKGVDVTCDVSLYHLFFDDASLFSLDSHLHVMPPFRTPADREALWNGILDGTIDAVSCAHKPVLPQDKEVNFEEALPGAISLEIAFVALVNEANRRGVDGVALAQKMLRTGSARIAGIETPSLQIGKTVSAFLYKPQGSTKVQSSTFAGNVENSPLLGQELTGSLVGESLNGSWRMI